MNLFKIAFSNIKKRKAGMITLFSITIVAGLMLSVGLNLILGLNGFFEKKVNELNSSHINVYSIDSSWQNDMYIFAENYNGVTQLEVESVYQNLAVGIKNTDLSIKFGAHKINMDRNISPLKIIDELSVMPKNCVVVPLSIKNYGFKSGDDITITTNQAEHTYTIYGFFEDAEFGATQITFRRFYFSDDAFETFATDSAFRSGKYLSIRFSDPKISSKFMEAFSNNFIITIDMFIFSIESSKMYATNFISLISTFVLIFAVVVFLIALIIARFNIVNSVEDDIVSFGALKSVGYTGRQIVTSIILQYLLVAGIASIIGSLIGVFISPIIGNILAVNSSLLWVKGFNFFAFLIAFVFILAATVLIAYIAGRKTNKITPVNALRAGLLSHSYEKNKLPILKTNISLHLNLGLKNFLSNMKNNVTVFLIITLFIFASLAGLLLQYNFSKDKTALNNMIGIELYPSIIFFQDGNEGYVNEVLLDEMVNRVSYIDGTYIMYEGTNIYLEAIDDYDYKEYQGNCYKGEYPKSLDEICIGGSFAKTIGKDVGDTIKIMSNGRQAEFTICGLNQYLKEGGFVFNVTLDGFKRFYDDYEAKMIKVYLNDMSNAQNFISKFSVKFAGIAEVSDDKKYVEAVSGSLENTINLVFIIIFISTMFIIAFVLFLMISTLIRKNKKNLGILKSLGFSNWQLMRQVLYTFMPVIIFSGIIGVLLCFVAVNPVISLALRTMGMMYSSFKIPVLPSLLVTGGIILFSLAMSLAISLRTKKISAIKLIVE